MEANFLANSMISYTEREIVASVNSNSIIDDFKSFKEHRTTL